MFWNTKRVYCDYAALTPIDPQVANVMKRAMKIFPGNPSSLHREGVQARRHVTLARTQIASFFKAHPDEITFTGSGTEANNLALFGAYEALIKIGKKPSDLHIVTSTIEHPSVLEPIRILEKKGVAVTYVGVNREALINLDEIKKAITPKTFLVSIMMVNNEVGSLQPIREIAKLVRHARKTNTLVQGGNQHDESLPTLYPLFHTDASQAPLYYEINTENLGADMITLDAHKMNGPRGIGILWTRRLTTLCPIIYGGKQEKGLRSATENVPAIVGFAEACKRAAAVRIAEADRIEKLRAHCLSLLQIVFPNIHENGPKNSGGRAPHILNVSFPGLDNEFLLLQLDAQGIACSTRSSCLAGEPGSYVLDAMNLPTDLAKTALRFSFGAQSKTRDLKILSKALSRAISIQSKDF